jgi:hypothetical protein
MQTRFALNLAIACSLLGGSHSMAQFTSGSEGSYGPLNVTSNMTLELPADGVFHCTTITIAGGATLTFNPNLLNTPVYLLATGDVDISGSIDVSGMANSGGIPGKGGPGGFDGGFGAFQGFTGGDGQGPGGGRSQSSAFGASFSSAGAGGLNTNVYGNTLLSPLIGGSGGAASTLAGGGGGGAILIASSTRISIAGLLIANGGGRTGGSSTTSGGAGSGGAIRIVAPVVDGNGQLQVNAGFPLFNSPINRASDGRTRIDSLDRFAHRNITLGGKGTRGSQMFVFPPGNPRLDIIHAGGMDIAEGADAPVTINLPLGSDTNQIVRVQARNFTNDVPIRVRITPENAPSILFDSVIPQSSGNPPFAGVPITLPLDTVCYIHAWTR